MYKRKESSLVNMSVIICFFQGDESQNDIHQPPEQQYPRPQHVRAGSEALPRGFYTIPSRTSNMWQKSAFDHGQQDEYGGSDNNSPVFRQGH
jgi:hypothetical protein